MKLTQMQSKILAGVGSGFMILLLLTWIEGNRSLQEQKIWGMPGTLFFSFLILIPLGVVLYWKGPKCYQKTGSSLLFFTSPLLSFFIADTLNNVNIFRYSFSITLLNYLAYFAVELVLLFLTGNLKISIIAGSAITFFFGIVNHYVSSFRGSPFLPWDILSAKTALSVADNYQFHIPASLVFCAVLYFFFLLLVLRIQPGIFSLNHGRLRILISRASALSVIAVYTFVVLGTQIPKMMGTFEFPWNQTNAYKVNGSFLNFLLNTKYLMVNRPDGYSVDKVKEIISSLDAPDYTHPNTSMQLGEPAQSRNYPNIIVVMNESFSDLNVVGNFQTDQEYLPYYHSLQENTIKGYTYVSVHGGSTCNSEFEMLTGSSNGFLPTGSVPYQQYIHQDMPALPNVLKNFGYHNAALHPYYANGWNRPEVYPYLGFDSFLSKEAWFRPEYIREYISDASNYDRLIQEYESMTEDQLPGQNTFLFNITMQNHGGYTDSDYQSEIHLKGLQGDYPQTEQYLSLIKKSDESLQQFIEYLKTRPEPVILLMFGDHQPNIEQSFYEELIGKDLEDFTLEELQKRYMTPFLIWANYDIPEQEIDAVSTNYLSTLLMDTAQIPLPPYNQFLKQLYQIIPVINANGYMDSEGRFYSFDQESPYEELINEYRILQYNNLFDPEHRVESIFQIPQ